ncbi:hypothetical protein VU01_12684 [Candidatus Electrothrix marina]|uniref:DUF1565 domain-containing protein n=1 Tax=Candidatus Electrothrix marina TaxID=1859130 RepID=A0A444JCF3_9BACT|nr:hypothetical protein VU01_12684 [Candidatus Electrothrix marina]
MALKKNILFFCTLFSLLPYTVCQSQGPEGLSPHNLLDGHSVESVTLVPFEEAVTEKLQLAKKKALSLIDGQFHKKGKKLLVPEKYKTIQSAINAATSGDSVVVKEGIYYEQLVMKDGVKLVSDSSNKGDELVPVDQAIVQLPRRPCGLLLTAQSLPHPITACLTSQRDSAPQPLLMGSPSRIYPDRTITNPVMPMLST